MKSDNPFPTYVLPKQLREIVEETHDVSNYPTSYIAASLLFAASVAIGNTRMLIINEEWTERPILFMSLVGRPGAMKSPPIHFAVKPFLKLDNFNLAKYKNALNEWRKLPEDMRGEKPIAKQLRVQDITMEAIAKILSETSHGIFVYVDELRGWIQSFNKYTGRGGDLEQWLSLFSGLPITVNRKTLDDILFIEEPFVGVIGGLQPNVMPRVFGGERMDNGFFYRILYVGNSSDGEPLLWKEEHDLPSDSASHWESIIYKVLDSGGYFSDLTTRKQYYFSADAWSCIVMWQHTKEESIINEADYVVEIFRKIQIYCLRFALIIHTLREVTGDIQESETIDVMTATEATLLADYFYTEALAHYEIAVKGGRDDENFFKLLDALDDSFTTDDAVSVGQTIGISRATVFRYLKVAPNDPFIRKMRRGTYEKKM